MLLTIPLVFLVFNREKDLNLMIQLWAWFTLLGVLKGVMQKVLGPDPWETYWLDTIGGKTHRLPQGLRIFSFFSDSSVFGGSMGFSGVFFSILGLHASQSRKKVFYIIVAAAAFLGMLLSGTRGAIAVPFAGFALYLLLSKRVKMMVIGGLAIIAVFSILKFTTLGESVYEIRRFRDALDPENPSLVVRKENQAKFRVYLADKPFGGGIGSAGNWGLRFTPGTRWVVCTNLGRAGDCWTPSTFVDLNIYYVEVCLHHPVQTEETRKYCKSNGIQRRNIWCDGCFI